MSELRNLVEKYIRFEGYSPTTQEAVDTGVISRLNGYTVRPGKVSDSIFGGKGSYEKDEGELVEFENPPLNDKNGVPLRIMVRTERISTHDIGRGEIPFKDQILALNHNYMRRLVNHLIGTSQHEVKGLGDNSVVIAAENLEQIQFENVLRAYMAKSSTGTSLYHSYAKKGRKEFCGHKLPDNLIINGPLPYVMDTPSTKEGHDESVPPQALINRGLCTPKQYIEIRNSSLVAFGAVSMFLRQKGILLVDTKTEHGTNHEGRIVSQDELYTMDSSRFWLLDDYNAQMEKFLNGEIKEISPLSFSKQFAREFSEGREGYTEEQRIQIAVRYIEGIQHLLGQPFVPDMRSRNERVIAGLRTIVEEVVD
ncbi:phosphoribosylaminoimidazolesuccinocarboxamide synthase [Candidatus Woesearchaeota archaeon]|nr:phosphoribosylaminoimidazolesuccinocarboxamide synthase [Candidatus Woesearchaeota archaeon]